MEKAIAESLDMANNYNEAKHFTSLHEADTKLNELEDGWLKGKTQKNLCFFYLNEPAEGYPSVKVSVFLSEDLNIEVFLGNVRIKRISCSDNTIIKLPVRVVDIITLNKVLREAKIFLIDNGNERDNVNVDRKAKLFLVLDILESVQSRYPEKSVVIEFLKEQINLLTSATDNRLRYTCETSLFACLLNSISPHGYKFLRSSGKLILPSPRTLKTICSSFNTDPRLEQNDVNFLRYAANKFKLLDEYDKIVVLMLDEIHLKANFDYKGGNIVGGAFNTSGEKATSAHTFMINSLRSNYKDVVHILPVHTISGENLHKIIKNVIEGLEKIGFEVLAIVTDNNALNKKAMSFFMEPPTVSNEYPHPYNPAKPLFYIIDPVHNVKNIRNNWINQKPEQTFYFPEFDSPDQEPAQNNLIRIASFKALKEMHLKEKDQLLKYGHTLTLKSLYPSSLERQNVKLVLKIFNHNVVAALKQFGPKISLTNYEDTALFIDIVCKWWDIVNVKTPLKGQRLRNKYQEPVTKSSAHIFNFLNSFLNWLKRWRDLDGTGHRLTKETNDALYQTTSALLKLSHYCLHIKHFNYILLGQVQTDKLEEHFGKYR